ncbi:MAG: GNAT family N-acetyltransferase [Acidimicrobiia bacterium]|nr:GNAT family N-acetyltransferase [Acidimicrobiia bacterium]
MTSPIKVRYEIDLTSWAPPSAHPTHRSLRPSDRDALAQLMLDAYIGTIDYEGETLADAIREVDDWLAGSPMLEHSMAIVLHDGLVSAVLVMELDGAPSIAIVMTHPDEKKAGLGRSAVEASLASVRQAGHRRVALYITNGNVASERLFASVGAVRVEG